MRYRIEACFLISLLGGAGCRRIQTGSLATEADGGSLRAEPPAAVEVSRLQDGMLVREALATFLVMLSPSVAFSLGVGRSMVQRPRSLLATLDPSMHRVSRLLRCQDGSADQEQEVRPGWKPPTKSSLVGTRWRLKLNLGLQPGSWMPQEIDGWGASGGRLLVSADVVFEKKLIEGDGDVLVGPAGQTRVLRVLQGGSVVTERGEEKVEFLSGGWCVQRPIGWGSEREGRLGIYLDCPTGMARRDISVPVGERMFFTTAVYDDVDGMQALVDERVRLDASLQSIEEQENAEASGLETVPVLGLALRTRRKILRTESKQKLSVRQRFFETSFPDLREDDREPRPAEIASRGTVSLKRLRKKLVFENPAYYVLGTFEAIPLTSDD